MDCPAHRHDGCYTRVTENIFGENATTRGCFDSERKTPYRDNFIYKKDPSKQIDFRRKKPTVT